MIDKKQFEDVIGSAFEVAQQTLADPNAAATLVVAYQISAVEDQLAKILKALEASWT